MRDFAAVKLDDLCNMLGIEKEDFMRLVPLNSIKRLPFPLFSDAMFEEESNNNSANHDDALEFLYDQRRKEDLKFQVQKAQYEMKQHMIDSMIKIVSRIKERDMNF
jgi:hypothetical protein